MKVLLIKRAALGDILMATPLIRQLKQNIPELQLDFLVSQEFSVAIKNNQYIDNVITIPSEMFSLKNVLSLFKFARSLRNKYDYVFILDKHYYFNFIGRVISKNTVGYIRDRISRLLLKYKVKYNDVMRYHGLYYLDLLLASRLATPDYKNIYLDFNYSSSDASFVKDVIAKYNLQENNFIIIINSGGNNQFESGGIRMLPESKILELINKISQNTKVVLLGGAIDKINYNNYLKKTNGDVINLAGEFNLSQSAVLMSYAKQIYTTDCGAMHIAVSQKVFDKLVCFFGPTCPNHVLPPGFKIKYYWGDIAKFDKNYPLYGELPKRKDYFAHLEVNKILLDQNNEIKTLY